MYVIENRKQEIKIYKLKVLHFSTDGANENFVWVKSDS